MSKNTENSRTRNSTRNMMWGLLYGASTIVLPFISRVIILQLLGIRYLGIGTLFTSVLQFLSLTELGIGTAITYIMYKPIAEGNTEELCHILRYIKRLYRIIGIVMLAVGTLLVPAVPYLTHGEAPADVNIYLLYYIYLINAVIGYFFAGYRESLLIAHQRKDVTNRWATLGNTVVALGQVIVLFLTRNIYAYAIVPIAGTILTNILVRQTTLKMYPEITPRGEIRPETRAEVRKKLLGLVGTKMNSIVLHSSDTIVISTFLGLGLTAMYGNYHLIFNSICGIIMTLFASMTASIGDKLVRDTLEQNYELFRHISFANNWLVGCCTVLLVCLLEPIIGLFYGSELQLGIGFTALMGVYFYIYQIQKTVLTFKDAAGIWYADRYRPYCVMAINLVSNIIMVQFIGIYGIVLSTILAFMISLPWVNKTLFSQLFHRPSGGNLLLMARNALVTAAISVVCWFLCSLLPENLIGLIATGVVCFIVSNALLFFVYSRSESFLYWKKVVLARLGKKKSA